MISMKVAVMGGGNGSHTIAADLTLKGLTVNMFELEQFAGSMREVFETRKIEMTGVAGSGTAKLNMVTSEIDQAVEDVEIIFIPLPGFAVAVYAELLAPFLKEEQIVVTARSSPAAGGVTTASKEGARRRVARSSAGVSYADVAVSGLTEGRKPSRHRISVVCRSRSESRSRSLPPRPVWGITESAISPTGRWMNRKPACACV